MPVLDASNAEKTAATVILYSGYLITVTVTEEIYSFPNLSLVYKAFKGVLNSNRVQYRDKQLSYSCAMTSSDGPPYSRNRAEND